MGNEEIGNILFLLQATQELAHLFLHGHVHQSYVHDFRAERVYRDTIVVNACGSHIIEIPDRPHKRLLLRKKG